MLACEEAFLLGSYVRLLDPNAQLVVGPVPTIEDEVFKHYNTRKESFRISGEKVPNRRGIERVIALLGATPIAWNDFVASDIVASAGWIHGRLPLDVD